MTAKKLSSPVSNLPKLAGPAQRALAGARVTQLSDLARMTEADVAALHGMGPNAMTSIKAAMKTNKLSFAKR